MGLITIRREQMKAFEAYVTDLYVDRAKVRVTSEFNDTARRLGPEGVEALVRDAVARAERYGITANAEVDRYLDLMIRLGPRFDEAPEHRWARNILSDGALDGSAKMDLLYDADELPAGARGHRAS